MHVLHIFWNIFPTSFDRIDINIVLPPRKKNGIKKEKIRQPRQARRLEKERKYLLETSLMQWHLQMHCANERMYVGCPQYVIRGEGEVMSRYHGRYIFVLITYSCCNQRQCPLQLAHVCSLCINSAFVPPSIFAVIVTVSLSPFFSFCLRSNCISQLCFPLLPPVFSLFSAPSLSPPLVYNISSSLGVGRTRNSPKLRL